MSRSAATTEKGFSPKLELSAVELGMHRQALRLCREHRALESQMVALLQKIERTKMFRKFGVTSLFEYSVRVLDLSESVAYAFIAVARKAREIPALDKAIAQRKISVSKANRVVSVLNRDNADKMLAFAATHSKREVEAEVAKINPKLQVRERAKAIAAGLYELRLSISADTFKKLERVQSLMAQKGYGADMSSAIEAALEAYLIKHDPVRKAQRALEKPAKVAKQALTELEGYDELCPGRVADVGSGSAASNFERTPLTAEQKHAVFARDEGRCTFKDSDGVRCGSDRWVEVHHIIPVSEGGTNDPANLTILCSAHHNLIHQVSPPQERPATESEYEM